MIDHSSGHKGFVHQILIADMPAILYWKSLFFLINLLPCLYELPHAPSLSQQKKAIPGYATVNMIQPKPKSPALN